MKCPDCRAGDHDVCDYFGGCDCLDHRHQERVVVLEMSEPTPAEIAAVQAEYATGGIDGAK